MNFKDLDILITKEPVKACDFFLEKFNEKKNIISSSRVEVEKKKLLNINEYKELAFIDKESFYKQRGDIIVILKNILIENVQQLFSISTEEGSNIDGVVLTKVQVDWGDSPSIGEFYGREQEMQFLEELILDESINIVSVIGLKGIGKTKAIMQFGKGGIGKTDLTTKVAYQIQDNFDFVIWRRLLNAPLLENLLSDIYFFFTGEKFDENLESLKLMMSKFKIQIKKFRCLIILDNVESIIENKVDIVSSKGEMRKYIEGYEAYADFFKMIGLTDHQSTLVLTSRENPEEVHNMSRKNGPVRTYNLGGLDVEACKCIFKGISDFEGDSISWNKINSLYQGNPLALELSARHIDSVFFGNLNEFLRSGKSVFKDLHQLVEWHFNRLTKDEQAILICLAINRVPMSLKDVREEFISDKLKQELPSNLQSIQRKIPIERHGTSFSIQPVLIEFLTDFIIESVNDELFTDNNLVSEALVSAVLKDFNSKSYLVINRFSLMKAVSKEYIRQSQFRLIVQPITNRLEYKYGSKVIVKLILNAILNEVRLNKNLPLGYLAGNILNLLMAIDGNLFNVDASNLYIRQANLQGVDVHNCNFDGSNIDKTSFTQTFAAVMGVDFSFDDEYLIIGDNAGVISAFDISAEKLIFSFRGHDSSIESIFFINNKYQFVTGSTDKFVKIWDFNTQKCISQLKGHTDWVRELAVSDKNSFLFSVSEDKSIIKWNMIESVVEYRKFYHKSWVDTVDVETDKGIVACSGHYGVINIINAKNGELIRTFKNPNGQWIRELKFISNTDLIVAVGDDGKIHIFNYETSTLSDSLLAEGEGEGLLTICYNSDSSLIATAGENGHIQLWDLESKKCERILTGHLSRVRTVRFSQSGKYFCSAGEDKFVKIWSAENYKCLVHLDGYTNQIGSADFDSSGEKILSGSEDGGIRIWNLDGKCIKKIEAHSAKVFDVKHSKRHNKIVSVSKDHFVRIWDATTYELLDQLNEHDDWIWACTISPAEDKFATCSEDEGDKRIIIWDLATHKVLGKLQGHTGRVWNVDFSPSCDSLVSCSGDFTVRVWNIKDYSSRLIIRHHNGRVWEAKYSICGNKIISVGDDSKIYISDSSTGNLIKMIHYGSIGIRTLAVHPTKEIFATGSDDGKVTIWSSNDFNQIIQYSEHSLRIADLEFSDDGNLLISCSEDEQIKIWLLESELSIKTISNPKPYQGSSFKNTTGLSTSQLLSLRQLGAIT
jgi:WD40 repeat protein